MVRSGRRGRGLGQLAVVPGGDPRRLHEVADALVGGVRHVIPDRVAGHPGQPTGHAAADLQHARRVVDQPGQASHLDAAQVEVFLAALHQAGEPRIPGQVESLLRGAIGPERDPATEHHVVHRHQVRRPVLVDRGELELAGGGQELGDLGLGHGDLVPLLHWLNPIVSVARASVSSQANPAGGPPGAAAAGNTGSSARRTASSVHMPSAEPCSAARNVARTRGGSMTAATPPCTTNTSPFTASAAGLARYTTSGATCSGASGSTTSSGAVPIRYAVMAVRARGQMALARTPYLPQLRAVVTVRAAMPALAAA